MKSLFEKKPLVLILAILALGALTVLSVSLRSVSFEDAQPIGREDAEQPFSLAPLDEMFDSFRGEGAGSQVILLAVMVAVLATLIGILLTPEMRKRFLRIVLRVGLTVLTIYFILNRYPNDLSPFEINPVSGGFGEENKNQLADIPPPVFTPPEETPWLSYLISVSIILLAALLLWKGYRLWRELNPRRGRSLREIAKVARTSLRDLSDGRESTDVILNCYFRMSDVVADKKNIRRENAMTPGEFSLRLEQSGLPGDAVRRLTRLFETVRYGNRKAGPQETNEAVACLTTILQYCGEPV